MREVLFIFIFLPFFTYSQIQENYFVKKNGEKVIVHEAKNGKNIQDYVDGYLESKNYDLTGQYFYYFDSKKRKKRIDQSKISEAFLDGRHFTNLKIGSFLGLNRLHEIIVENNDYILTQYYFNRMRVYLLDKKSGEFIIKNKEISKKKKHYKSLVEQEIFPYFESCYEFINQVKNKLSSDYPTRNLHDNFLFYKTTNINCTE